MPSITGTVLEIQRMSTEDGPGLRTTLFLKGCSLHCRWCHNPESIALRAQVHWTGARCLACGLCVAACPSGALSRGPAGVAIDRALCRSCGTCAAECPSTALEMWGRSQSVDEAFGELVKDKAYFGADGGVTVSGGEACLQAPFVRELFSRLKAAGIGTAIDTCGMCSGSQFAMACELADVILYDLKDSDPERHAANIGGDFNTIIGNFRLALAMVAGSAAGAGRKRLWVRTPIIPGMTDGEANIRGIAKLLRGEALGLVERWELCAFNNLCAGKYEALGRGWELSEARLMGASEMGALVGATIGEGWPADRVRWTGMTRTES